MESCQHDWEGVWLSPDLEGYRCRKCKHEQVEIEEDKMDAKRLIEEMYEHSGEIFGEEFLQEHNEDCAFLESVIDKIGVVGLKMAVILALDAGYPMDSVLNSLIYESMLIYRDYLIQKGIDVRALEGR